MRDADAIAGGEGADKGHKEAMMFFSSQDQSLRRHR